MESQSLSLRDYENFIEVYSDGIMNTGLLKPLANLSDNSDISGVIAKSWYDLQLQGLSPQAALNSPSVTLPDSIKKLLITGFEKSVLDLVLKEIITSFKEVKTDLELINRFSSISKKFQSVNTSTICVGCERSEISKIISRATIEGADEVLLQQDKDFLVQSFIGTKLVQVREAAIPAVYRTMLHAFESANNKTMSLEQGEFQVYNKNNDVFFYAEK